MVTSATKGPLPTGPVTTMSHGVSAASSSASSYSHDTGMEPGDQHNLNRPTTANPSRKHRNGSASGESIKGRIRRASMSLKGIVLRERRGSEPATDINKNGEMRPTTSHSTWQKLRQAASFRHSRNSYGSPDHLETIYSPVQSEFPALPIPGNGLQPPIIPWHTGAAARQAASGAHNESFDYVGRSFYRQLMSLPGPQNDGESGIGITLTACTSQADMLIEDNAPIIRRDFISELPPELAVQILSQLDAAQLATASRVCRLWYSMIQDQHIWRASFLREKTSTYATGLPIQPGSGSGVPAIRPGNDWHKIYKAREELDERWKIGKKKRAVFLNGHSDSVYCQQFDENKIITGSRDKTIRIWDMHTLQCRLIIGPPDVVNDTSLLFDPAGEPTHYALYPESQYVVPSVPVTVSFPIHHSASILCLQYDDDILVTGSSDSTCIVYSVRSGYRPVRRLEFHTAAVLDLAFDDKYIVTCSKDSSIVVWDRATFTVVKQLNGHTGPVNAVQLRGNTLVSCSGDFTVKLWNIASGKVIRDFAGHTKGLACSQFSDDGRFVASAGSDKVIRIWDANTGECLREIQAHESLVRSLHIDSVSGRLVSGSYDTDIKVFDMETGVQTLDFPGWHASWVLSAKSDYRRIVSTGQDAKILIMDFGADVRNIEMLESVRKHEVACEIRNAGFI